MSIREDLWGQVRSRCAQRGNRQFSTLRFIGHSLGGAIATLSSLDFMVNADQCAAGKYQSTICDSLIQISCRTFGSPNVGDKDFIDLFNGEIKDSNRYAIKGDLVPLILNGIKDYFHVDRYVELVRTIPKHKIEFYIAILVKMAKPVKIEDEKDSMELQSGRQGYLLSGLVGIGAISLTYIYMKRKSS